MRGCANLVVNRPWSITLRGFGSAGRKRIGTSKFESESKTERGGRADRARAAHLPLASRDVGKVFARRADVVCGEESLRDVLEQSSRRWPRGGNGTGGDRDSGDAHQEITEEIL